VADVKTKQLGKLSKGYRQRVGLAQAIIHNPDVLILDEPTAGLDPKQINETRDLIRSLAGDHTIILSTHILPEVEQTCEEVVINKGKIVATDSVRNFRSRARGSESLWSARPDEMASSRPKMLSKTTTIKVSKVALEEAKTIVICSKLKAGRIWFAVI
jgi:ABC-type multidrug transport system ATPase subunit